MSAAQEKSRPPPKDNLKQRGTIVLDDSAGHFKKEDVDGSGTRVEGCTGAGGSAFFCWSLPSDRWFIGPGAFGHWRYHADEHLRLPRCFLAHRGTESSRTSQPDRLRSLVELRSCCGDVNAWPGNRKSKNRIPSCLCCPVCNRCSPHLARSTKIIRSADRRSAS